jgi:hypothetical protein
MNTAPIISKAWRFCTMLRDDGVEYAAITWNSSPI